ncbi:ribbon-helix-helix domain-containing protein, partial [Rhizobium leguminosarum]
MGGGRRFRRSGRRAVSNGLPHSATLHGHRTSFSLEDEFWAELKTIAG